MRGREEVNSAFPGLPLSTVFPVEEPVYLPGLMRQSTTGPIVMPRSGADEEWMRREVRIGRNHITAEMVSQKSRPSQATAVKEIRLSKGGPQRCLPLPDTPIPEGEPLCVPQSSDDF